MTVPKISVRLVIFPVGGVSSIVGASISVGSMTVTVLVAVVILPLISVTNAVAVMIPGVVTL